MEVTPTFLHKEPTYWGKPIQNLIDLELVQAYEYILEAEAKREAIKNHPKFNNPWKRLVLPPPNKNFVELKEAILSELEKRNIQL